MFTGKPLPPMRVFVKRNPRPGEVPAIAHIQTEGDHIHPGALGVSTDFDLLPKGGVPTFTNVLFSADPNVAAGNQGVISHLGGDRLGRVTLQGNILVYNGVAYTYAPDVTVQRFVRQVDRYVLTDGDTWVKAILVASLSSVPQAGDICFEFDGHPHLVAYRPDLPSDGEPAPSRGMVSCPPFADQYLPLSCDDDGCVWLGANKYGPDPNGFAQLNLCDVVVEPRMRPIELVTAGTNHLLSANDDTGFRFGFGFDDIERYFWNGEEVRRLPGYYRCDDGRTCTLLQLESNVVGKYAEGASGKAGTFSTHSGADLDSAIRAAQQDWGGERAVVANLQDYKISFPAIAGKLTTSLEWRS